MPIELPLNAMSVEEKVQLLEQVWDNLCRPNEAIAFPKVYAAHRSDSVPRSRARRDWPSSSACRRLREVRTR